VQLWGSARATRDIDINVFVPQGDASGALRVLGGIGVTVYVDGDTERVNRDSQVRLRWGPVPIDLFFSALDFHDECRRRTRVVPFGDAEIPILSAEDLAVCRSRSVAGLVDLRECCRSGWLRCHLHAGLARRYGPTTCDQGFTT
jgi:hypothetical protein